MAYTPPVGTVNRNLAGTYIPPVGTVDLDIGSAEINPDDRLLTVAATTGGASGAVSVVANPRLVVAARTGGAIAAVVLGVGIRIQARTGGARCATSAIVDPNLLSAVHAWTPSSWQDGRLETQGVLTGVRDSQCLTSTVVDSVQDALSISNPVIASWCDSPSLSSMTWVRWRDADRVTTHLEESWRSIPLLTVGHDDRWRDADHRVNGIDVAWMSLPAILIPLDVTWKDGLRCTVGIDAGFKNALLLGVIERERWRQAGYPGNAPNPGPPIPPTIPWPWGSNLHLRCPLHATPGFLHLNIGRSPCHQYAEFELPVKPSYLSVNTASLLLLPDRTELPCTAMSIKTDTGSWGWQLNASLVGPDVFDLIRPLPSGYPREVEATINGWTWTFVLEIPDHDRVFSQTQVQCTGWSTSVWMHTPYTPVTIGTHAFARTAHQLAEEALEFTGWSIDWQLDDWLIPAGVFRWEGTRMDRIMRLLKPVGGCLYTYPSLKILRAYSFTPQPSWLWEAETADVNIPETLVLKLTHSPQFTPSYNGVYVSGTTHGKQAWVKITGTDGMVHPATPISDVLLCDENGVALRMAGIHFLSSCGLGWTTSVDTLLAPQSGGDGTPLIEPGQLIAVGGKKGRVRSININATRSGGFAGLLSVRQRLELERREIDP